MKQVLIFLMLVWLALTANATPTDDFSDAAELIGSGGFEDPRLLVQFNPQPEPPAPAVISLENPFAPVFTSPLVGIRPGGEVTLRTALAFALPDTRGAGNTFERGLKDFDGNTFGFEITDAAGIPIYGMHLAFGGSESGPADTLSIVAFNPQPEPPAPGFAGQQLFGLDVTFEVPAAAGGLLQSSFGLASARMAAASMIEPPFVNLTLRVEDLRAKTFLSFDPQAVPAPPVALLALLGALALVTVRRQHGRAR